MLTFANVTLTRNTCSLTISNLQRITNTYPPRLTNSAGALPSLHTNAIVTVLTRPTITNQPVSLTTGVGSNVTFRVGVRGTAPLGYQWFKDGAPLFRQTNSTLNFASLQVTNERAYF